MPRKKTHRKNFRITKKLALSRETKPTLSRETKPALPRETKPALPRETKPAVPEGEKSSLYETALNEAEKLDFKIAAGSEGLDEEITLLRVKIKEILESKPNNLELTLNATNILAKLIRARYNTNKKQEKNLGEAIKNVFRDIGVPLGMTILNKKL
jgi:hypothetical protein